MNKGKVIPGVKIFLCCCLMAGLACCSHLRKLNRNEVHQLEFLGEYDLPHKMTFKGTTIGGLSGIDYDAKQNKFYIISDDRSEFSPARFYTAKVHVRMERIDSVELEDVKFLSRPGGGNYPNSKLDAAHTPDPESMRYDPVTNELVWSSEGERIVTPKRTVLEDPAVTIIGMDGKYRDSFVLPPNLHMQASETGPRQNGVFEGLTYADNFQTLYVNVEEPLYQDGPRAATGDTSGWIRIIKYDVRSRAPIAQYAYLIDPVAESPVPAGAFKINGVPDILWLGDDKLMVTERSFSSGRQGCVIKVYIANLKGATDVSNTYSLTASPNFKPISKSLLLDMRSLGIYIDNIEGATFGPLLPDGHRSLLFVSDDNFSKDQKTQFLLFKVK